MPFPQHKEYEETSWVSYYLYTDQDIRQAPKISQHYIYNAPDGGAREMSNIMFYDAFEPASLRLYLKTIGFHWKVKQKTAQKKPGYPIQEEISFSLLAWTDKKVLFA